MKNCSEKHTLCAFFVETQCRKDLLNILSELTKMSMKFCGKAVTKYKTVNGLEIELLLTK